MVCLAQKSRGPGQRRPNNDRVAWIVFTAKKSIALSDATHHGLRQQRQAFHRIGGVRVVLVCRKLFGRSGCSKCQPGVACQMFERAVRKDAWGVPTAMQFSTQRDERQNVTMTTNGTDVYLHEHPTYVYGVTLLPWRSQGRCS